MALTLEQITPPNINVWTLSELKQELRIDMTDDDLLLRDMMVAAEQDVETFTSRQLLTATWRLSADDWQAEFRLPRPPAQSVDMIEYIDPDGTLQTLSTSIYQVDTRTEPARIRLAPNQSWPSLDRHRYNAVQITYKAGHSSRDAVPGMLRRAVAQIVGDYYEHREGQLDIAGSLKSIEENPTLSRLLWRYRIAHI